MVKLYIRRVNQTENLPGTVCTFRLFRSPIGPEKNSLQHYLMREIDMLVKISSS